MKMQPSPFDTQIMSFGVGGVTSPAGGMRCGGGTLSVFTSSTVPGWTGRHSRQKGQAHPRPQESPTLDDWGLFPGSLAAQGRTCEHIGGGGLRFLL